MEWWQTKTNIRPIWQPLPPLPLDIESCRFLSYEHLGTSPTLMTTVSHHLSLHQTEHRNPEGRTYWFNTGTKQSVWEKPDGNVLRRFIQSYTYNSLLDLKTPFEVHRATYTNIFFGSYCSFQRALTQTKWKEYFSGGRKYYYNVSFFGALWIAMCHLTCR